MRPVLTPCPSQTGFFCASIDRIELHCDQRFAIIDTKVNSLADILAHREKRLGFQVEWYRICVDHSTNGHWTILVAIEIESGKGSPLSLWAATSDPSALDVSSKAIEFLQPR